jgi:hypothetical protein
MPVSRLKTFLEEKTQDYSVVRRKSQKREILQVWSIEFGATGLDGNERFFSFKNGHSTHNRASGKHALQVFRRTPLGNFNLLIYGTMYQIAPQDDTTTNDFAELVLADNPEMVAWENTYDWCLFAHHEGEIVLAYR